jgi:hypothetical protein
VNHIETAGPAWRFSRAQARAEKRQRQVEIRREAELAASNRIAAQICLLTAHLEVEVAKMDARIAADLVVAAVKDPSHSAFPISTKAMIARRDNLKATIRALSERGKIDGLE